MADHITIMELIIGYTCVGIFVCTAVITLLSLVNVVKIEEGYQKKLFGIVVVEVAVICVGAFSGLVKFNPAPVQEKLAQADSATKALRKIETSTTQAGPSAAPASVPASLKPRVYIQIANASQRDMASKASSLLVDEGSIVPDFETVGTKAPRATELRYFTAADKTKADALVKLLGDNGIAATPKFVPGYASSAVSPNHFELWFAQA